MAGRPRKPTALKILSGNPGKRPLPDEREVEHGAAEKPLWFAGAGSDPLPVMVWDELAPSRISMGLLTSVTVEEFAQLCIYVAAFRRERDGMDVAKVRVMNQKLNAFGFNPSALAKLGIATPKTKATNRFATLA